VGNALTVSIESGFAVDRLFVGNDQLRCFDLGNLFVSYLLFVVVDDLARLRYLRINTFKQKKGLLLREAFAIELCDKGFKVFDHARGEEINEHFLEGFYLVEFAIKQFEHLLLADFAERKS
jgi:hypothetical protein